ncbi:MAG: ADP-ribosylation factor-like protein [Promethearchaeota archaeon]
MLRQVFIIFKDKVLYERNYGKALSNSDLTSLLTDIKKEAFLKEKNDIGNFDYYNFKLSFIANKDLDLIFIFVSGLTDDLNKIKTKILEFMKEFLKFFSDSINIDVDPSVLEVINPIIDAIHRNLKPKISIIGFSGVGKTTITNLIKVDEIPLEYVPTNSVDIATVKIGKLTFLLWDLKEIDQFNPLWNDYIKGSNAILLITDSSLENVDKSKNYLELIKEEAPYAHLAIIANKQDLPDALNVQKIEEIMGLKTYSMVAIEPKNQGKMIQIIADILDINAEDSPLLKPIFERDNLINLAENALIDGNFEKAADFFDKIGEICIEIGDDSVGKEILTKAMKIREFLKNIPN